MPDMDGIEFARHLLKLAAAAGGHLHHRVPRARDRGVRGARDRLPAEADARAAAARRAAEGAAAAPVSMAERSSQLPDVGAALPLGARARARRARAARRRHLPQGRAQVRHRAHRRARVPARGIAHAARAGVRQALRARAPQLPGRARRDPRLRAPRQRRRRRALGSAAERRGRVAAGVPAPAVRRARVGRESAERRGRSDAVASRLDAPVAGPTAPHCALRLAMRSRISMPMRTLVCGSLAYDTIMVFPDRFARHILPDQTHVLSVSFQIGEMRREWGGCAGNIAYNLQARSAASRSSWRRSATTASSTSERLAALGIAVDGVRHVPGAFTAQAFIITDLDDNQITAFHPGRDELSHQSRVGGRAPTSASASSRPTASEGMRSHARAIRAGRHSVRLRSGPGHDALRRRRAHEMIEQARLRRRERLRRTHARRAHRLRSQSIAERVEALVVTLGGEGSRHPCRRRDVSRSRRCRPTAVRRSHRMRRRVSRGPAVRHRARLGLGAHGRPRVAARRDQDRVARRAEARVVAATAWRRCTGRRSARISGE